MLKLTIVGTAVLVATGGGVAVAAPGSAQVVTDTHDYRKSVSRSHNLGTRQLHRNRNYNLNEEDAINRLRLPFTSTNTVAPTVNVSPVAAPAAVATTAVAPVAVAPVA